LHPEVPIGEFTARVASPTSALAARRAAINFIKPGIVVPARVILSAIWAIGVSLLVVTSIKARGRNHLRVSKPLT
jgi:hypothetical protein